MIIPTGQPMKAAVNMLHRRRSVLSNSWAHFLLAYLALKEVFGNNLCLSVHSCLVQNCPYIISMWKSSINFQIFSGITHEQGTRWRPITWTVKLGMGKVWKHDRCRWVLRQLLF